MQSNIKTIKRWKNLIEETTNDIADLVEDRYVFNEITSIVKKNQKLNKDNLFWDFLRTNYVASMVLGVCRQADINKNSLSLVNLLNEIFENPEVIIKEWFVAQYQKGKQGETKRAVVRQGEADFEKNFGRGNFIEPSIIYSDIGSLLYCTREIKKFRNKRIAHKDKNHKLKFNVNFNDLNKAIDALEQTTIKYNLLLNQSGYIDSTLLPAIQYDWQEIFRIAWIK